MGPVNRTLRNGPWGRQPGGPQAWELLNVLIFFNGKTNYNNNNYQDFYISLCNMCPEKRAHPSREGLPSACHSLISTGHLYLIYIKASYMLQLPQRVGIQGKKCYMLTSVTHGLRLTTTCGELPVTEGTPLQEIQSQQKSWALVQCIAWKLLQLGLAHTELPREAEYCVCQKYLPQALILRDPPTQKSGRVAGAQPLGKGRVDINGFGGWVITGEAASTSTLTTPRCPCCEVALLNGEAR